MRIYTHHFIRFDKFCDWVPVVSTLSNIANIFVIYIVIPLKERRSAHLPITNHYFTHLKEKSAGRCAILALPGINIFFKLYKLKRSRQTSVQLKEKVSEQTGTHTSDSSSSQLVADVSSVMTQTKAEDERSEGLHLCKQLSQPNLRTIRRYLILPHLSVRELWLVVKYAPLFLKSAEGNDLARGAAECLLDLAKEIGYPVLNPYANGKTHTAEATSYIGRVAHFLLTLLKEIKALHNAHLIEELHPHLLASAEISNSNGSLDSNQAFDVLKTLVNRSVPFYENHYVPQAFEIGRNLYHFLISQNKLSIPLYSGETSFALRWAQRRGDRSLYEAIGNQSAENFDCSLREILMDMFFKKRDRVTIEEEWQWILKIMDRGASAGFLTPQLLQEAFCMAIQICEDLTILQRLLERGANVRDKTRYGNTPLHYAAQELNKEKIEFLLHKGADLEINNEGRPDRPEELPYQTALQAIVRADFEDIGGEIFAFSEQEYRQRDELLELLSPHQEARHEIHQSLLNHALCKAIHFCTDLSVLQRLLDQGAEINHKNQYGFTPLHYAARTFNEEKIQFLLAQGADLEAQSSDVRGYNPVEMPYQSALRYFLESDPRPSNSAGVFDLLAPNPTARATINQAIADQT